MRVINGLHFKNLRGDIVGGMAAALVVLPLALAMGYASGAGPLAGIYGAVIVGVLAALLGGTPSMVSGPTGITTVVMAIIFTHYSSVFPDNPGLATAIAFTVVMMAGLLQFLMGILRAGRFIEMIPYPVVSGFISGMGIILILTQLAPLLGSERVTGTFAAFNALGHALTKPDQAALVLGLLTLAIVLLVPKFVPRINQMIPAPFLALVSVTLIAMLFIDDQMVLLAELPAVLPNPVQPVFDLQLLPGMLMMALVLALLVSMETLRVSGRANLLNHQPHLANRELGGQGLANAVAGLFAAMPGAGSEDRTLANHKNGGQTPVSGTIHALVLLLVLFIASKLAAAIPVAVLSAILVKVGIDMIDWAYLREIRQESSKGVLLMLVVMLITMFVNLFIAVGIGMVIALFVLTHRVTRHQLSSMHIHNEPSEMLMLSFEEQQALSETGGRAVLFRMHSEIGFGAARGMFNKVSDFDDYDVLILDMTEVPLIDYSACQVLDRMVADCIGAGREVMIVGVRSQLGSVLKKLNVMDRIHSDYRFVKLIGALREARNYIDRRGIEEASLY